MANRLIKVGNSFNTPQKYYICEKLSEMGTTGNFGDIVLCAEDGLTYMKDSNGVWQEVSLGGGGGGGAIKQLPDPKPEDEGKFAKVINGQWDVGEGGSGTVDALTTEEMMELFVDTNLTESAGVDCEAYVEDPEGNYIYNAETGDYEEILEGTQVPEGTATYSLNSGYVGYEENGVTYILTY